MPLSVLAVVGTSTGHEFAVCSLQLGATDSGGKYYKAEYFRGRRLQLDDFLCKHEIDVTLPNKPHLSPDRAFRF